MNFDPPHLAALSAVLQLGSFDGAAAALGVTPSAVSQRIKALEDRVGTPLVNRTSPCTGTETLCTTTRKTVFGTRWTCRLRTGLR